MKAVVMAAGEGTRMGPLTKTRPKPLLPVAGTTLLENVMDQCVDAVDGFVLVVGHQSEMVEERVGDTYRGLPVDYAVQDEQLGTAHAVEQAEPYVDERFLLLNADVVVDDSLVAALAESEGYAVAVREVPDPSNYGVVSLDGDRVTGIVEKPAEPPSSLANLGAYAFEPAVFDYVAATEKSERGEYEITESIARALADGVAITAVEYEGEWLDVGRPWELLNANEHLLADLDHHVEGVVEDGATVHGPVVVENGARVRAGAYVEGPAVIQSGADVGPNCYVRGSTVVGEDVRVGNAVEVKNSILMTDAAVGHLSYVGDSILGESVNFGASTTVANLRHDDANVRMQVKGDMIDTGRRKLGVVVGDASKTGINTSLNAGVRLDPESTTTLGETVTRDKVVDRE
ncbi:bifunctional sugar-1-phosphate nucleotidylyltransferase/acetyltransferase [Halocalculus aciditolerans]|uniref:Bifunctional protein GlmU n=1 Tax=Halocalculus aciditolerans TaxID=1383812 RepID=A0A830FBT3_9EURY|nr:bifunctional sugar-1-phosphate nucleotidylyltransferase/acetyltransferase [Halocalculus aciditolerans]GGL59551.1 glucose-1-phosphate thymidylyltransferase [Halocalculus aciditolerans]